MNKVTDREKFEVARLARRGNKEDLAREVYAGREHVSYLTRELVATRRELLNAGEVLQLWQVLSATLGLSLLIVLVLGAL